MIVLQMPTQEALMKSIKRLSTSIIATLESAVGQLENHDTIIEASINTLKVIDEVAIRLVV